MLLPESWQSNEISSSGEIPAKLFRGPPDQAPLVRNDSYGGRYEGTYLISGRGSYCLCFDPDRFGQRWTKLLDSF